MRIRRRSRSAMLIAGALALAGVIGVGTPWGYEFEQRVGLAWLFHLRGPATAPAGVVVAAIDDQTGPRLGLSALPREWPRSVHGRLVDNLVRRGAAAVVFDFDFQTRKQADDDAAFAAAIARAGRVVLAEKLLGKRQPIEDAAGHVRGSVWVEKLVPPIAPLAQAAAGLGAFPLPKVQVAVHEFWAFKPSVGDAPTMPAAALQVQAAGAYRHLLALAALADANLTAALPPLPDPPFAADRLRAAMLDLRRAFTVDSTLAPRVLALIDRLPADVFDSTEREQVCALVGLYTGPEHRTLNYYGPPGSIPTIPYHRLAVDAAADDPTLPDLRGATVFVGFSDLYDPGQPDRFYTVYTNADGVDLSGVEIAATSFANLKERASVHMQDGNQALALAAGIGIMLGLLCCMVPAWYGVPLALLTFAGYVVLARALFTAHHLWLPLATPALVQLPLALVGGLTLQYLSERAKKARAEAAISRYLPAHLAHDFTEQNIDESALNSVTYSVCFASDMAGFTRIAEQLKPKELAAFLNDYFESLATPLRAHGVDVIEFRADGVMCAWTSPDPVASIRRAAAAAALEAVAAIDAFKRRHALLAQSLRIGLECGMVYVGHAGGGGHFVYSIVGDCANTAARIEGLNKQLGTQCLASRAAIEDVPGLLLRDLGDFRFVGKTEPVAIVELLGWEAEADPGLRDLGTRFNDALALLRAGLWPPAQAAFDALRRDYPDDGPAAWHLARCERHARTPGTEPAWVITLDSK